LSRRAMTTNRWAWAGEAPHCQATQCSGDRIPHPVQESVASTSAISSTSRALVAFNRPHTSAISASNRATARSRPSPR